MKLTCDICNGALEMNTNGQSAVCSVCGVTYSAARLKEKISIENSMRQELEEIVYDVTDFEVVDAADEAKQFWLLVENLFQIKGRGMVVCGYVQGASVHVNDLVTVIRADGFRIETKVLGIERNKVLYDRADPCEAVGILLENTKPNQISVGDVLAITAEAKQSVSDYYTIIRCKNCNSFLRIPANWDGPLPNCPDCNTPF